MKQTAVEWFYQRILAKDIKEVFEQAKEMEKEQIVEACENTIKSFELDKDKTGFFVMSGEGYYNETYKI